MNIKIILIAIVVIHRANCSIYDDLKIISSKVSNATFLKTAPDELSVAVGDAHGNVVIYDFNGNILTNTKHHESAICGIEWLYEFMGPITISTQGRIAFWNGTGGQNIKIVQSNLAVVNTASVADRRVDGSQYLALNNGTNIQQWNIRKQIYQRRYRDYGFNFRSLTYAENFVYLVASDDGGFLRYYTFDSFSQTLYFNFTTPMDVIKGGNYTFSVLGISNYTLVSQYSSTDKKVSERKVEFAKSISYCGGKYYAIGQKSRIEVVNYLTSESSFVEGLSGVMEFIDCKGQAYMYALNSEGELAAAKLSEFPMWLIYVLGGVGVLILLAIIIGCIYFKKRRREKLALAYMNLQNEQRTIQTSQRSDLVK